MELKTTEINEMHADILEGSFSQEDYKLQKHDDLIWWGRVLRRRVHMVKSIEQGKELRKRRWDIASNWIDKEQSELESFDLFIKDRLENSPFKTDKGHKVSDPEAGSIFLPEKKKVKYEITDDEHWIAKGFVNNPNPKPPTVNKIDLNKHLDQFKCDGDKLVDEETGEIIHGVSVTYERKLQVRV